MKSILQNLAGSILAVALLISFNNKAQSQTGNISQINNNINRAVEQTTPYRNIINSDLNSLDLEYTFNGIALAEKTVNKTKYNYLHIDGFAKMANVGEPALPAHNDIIMLPGNSTASIQIVSSNYNEYDNYYIHPALEAASDEEGAPEPEFQINEQVYTTNSFYPSDVVSIQEVQKIRGNSFATVQIRPVQFNPVTKKIRVYSNIKYKLVFSGDKSSVSKLQNNSSQQYLNSIRSTFLNKNIIPKESNALYKASSSKEYIIIAPTSYTDPANRLAEWKRQLGYTVDVCLKSSWTYDQVEDSVHYKYNNWTPKPDYVVILGSHNEVPGKVIGSYLSDLYITCMDGVGDYVPDMAKGRLSASSLAEANTIVDKIINYEKNPPNSSSYYSTSANCSYFQDGSSASSYHDGYADRRFLHTSEEVRDYMMNQGYTVNRVYEALSGRNPTNYNNGYYSNGEPLPSDLLVANGFNWDGGTADISSEINAGRFLLIHRDHGYTGGYGWAHPQYVNIWQHINNLSNGNEQPVVFSINCHTGDFSATNAEGCFAENFLRKANGGAVGVVAPSYTSYSGYNDAVMTGMIDAIWSNPGLVANFGFGGVSNPSLTSHNDIRTMGDVVNMGLLRMTQTWNSSSKWQMQHEIYHYFGDPAMKIWTQNPTQISANIADTLVRFANSISINNANYTDATATLLINGELVDETVLTNGLGSLNFTYNDTVTAVVTISGENFRPLVQKVFIRNNVVNHEPSQQASNISFTEVAKSSSLDVSWENGDGDFRLLIMNSSENFTDPVDGVEYTANETYENNGQQVMYNGEDNSTTVYGLTEGVIYWFRVYEYNNTGQYTLYVTWQETNNPNNPDGSSSLLPVELVYFDAYDSDYQTILEWKTASEKNNDYFTLEKSSNGYDYKTIQIVDGQGTSLKEHTYSYTDKDDRNSEVTYYRLSQTDFNGKTTTYSPIAVFGKNQNNFSITNIYTNDNKLNIYYNSVENKEVIVNITDLNGKCLLRNSQTNLTSNAKFEFNSINLQSGVYFATITDGDKEESKKFIIK